MQSNIATNQNINSMKKLNLFTKHYLIVLIPLIFSCSQNLENPIVTLEQNQPLLKTLSYNDLPFDIKNLVKQNIDKLKEVSKTKKSVSEFGNIGNRANVDESIENKIIYSIELETVLGGFYYDNIVLTKQIDGEFTMNTIRYTPDLEWHTTPILGEENRYERYSGSIEIFNEKAESVFQSNFTNGEANGYQSKSSNSTSRCSVSKIESYGLYQNGGFYLEGINIWVEGCGGSDTSFLNGSDSSVGNPSTSNGGSGASDGRAGSGGRGSVRTTPIIERKIVVVTPDKPISDMVDFLKCFDSSKSAQVTIYVAEPNPGSGDTHSGTNVGHTFVSITQGTSTATFGFYPATDNIYPIINPSDPSKMGEDGGKGFSASISRTVTSTQFASILSYSRSFKNTYDLNTYNCSDFGIEVGNLAGFNLPDSYGTWPGGGGSNPGTLGVYIRSQTSDSTQTVNKKSGISPATKKGC